MSTPQKPTYRPTRKERDLLDAILDPANRHLSRLALCEKAGCSRDIYYAAWKKPGFVEVVDTEKRRLLDQVIIPVINATAKQAIAGSAPHARLILELRGDIVDRKVVSGTINHNHEFSVLKLMQEIDGGTRELVELKQGEGYRVLDQQAEGGGGVPLLAVKHDKGD